MLLSYQSFGAYRSRQKVVILKCDCCNTLAIYTLINNTNYVCKLLWDTLYYNVTLILRVIVTGAMMFPYTDDFYMCV